MGETTFRKFGESSYSVAYYAFSMKPVCKVIQTSEEMDMARSIRMEVFVKGQDVPISIEMDEYDEIATHVICQYGDKFIGTGRLVQHGNQVKLGRVAVLEESRGLGAGQAIMLKLIEEAKKLGDVQIWGNAQVWALEFYENLGFVVAGEEFLEAGIVHVRMNYIGN